MLPLGFAPNVSGARFKKDEGVRPIAVCKVLRRMVAKVVLKTATPDIQEFFPPLQIGGGGRGGISAAVARLFHLARAAHSASPFLFAIGLHQVLKSYHFE